MSAADCRRWTLLDADRGAHPPARADRARAARCSASSRAAPTRRACSTRSRELGYRVSALHVDHGLRGAESDADARFCAEQLGAEVVRADGARRDRGGAARAPLRAQRPDRLRATGHTASDQVETILYRLVTSGNTKGIKAAPRGRRRAAAAAALARGDRGLLPRARARVPRRLVERRHDARADPRRDPAAARADPSRRRARTSCARSRAAHAAAGARRAARRAGRARGASTSAAASRRCASTTGSGSSRARSSCAARSTGAVGASAPSCQALWCADGGPATGSPAARRRSRTCSSTPRSRAPTVKAGRSSCAATRSWPCPGSSRRDGVEAVRRMSQTELERGVGEILIDEERLQARIRELGARDHRRLRGPRAAARRRAQGRRLLHGRPDARRSRVPCEIDFMAISSYGASTDSSGVVRILKDLDINIEGRHVLVIEDIIDSGLTLSYLVRNLESREPGEPRGLRAPDEAGAARDRGRRALRRLRDPEPVRDRLRARFRRALPESALRRRAARRSDARRASERSP